MSRRLFDKNGDSFYNQQVKKFMFSGSPFSDLCGLSKIVTDRTEKTAVM